MESEWRSGEYLTVKQQPIIDCHEVAIEQHTARNHRLNSYRKIIRLIDCSVDGYHKSNTLEIEHKRRRASYK